MHLVIGPIICPVICPVISFDYPSCYLVLPSRVWHSSFIMLSEGGLQCKFIRTFCYLTWKWQTVIKLKKSERPPLKSSMKAMIGCQPWQIFFFFIVGLSTQLYYTGKNENANIIKVHKSWCFLKSRPLGWRMTTTLLAYFQKLVDLWEFWLECPMSIMTIVKCLANFFLKIYKRKKWLSIPNYYIFP